MQQRTLKNEVVFEGIGVHSGQPAKIILTPAVPNSGIVFSNPHFSEDVFRIGSVIPEVAMLATVLKNDKWILSTTEHLLAAIVGLGLDNVLIQVYGVEIPIMDGSAAAFVQGIHECGFQIQDTPKKYLTPKEVLKFEDLKTGRFIHIYPAQDNLTELLINYTGEFTNKLVGDEKFECALTSEFFSREISPARTFGFLEQLPQMRKLGVAKGTSLGNTLVLSNEGFLNEPRFKDECIRHKVLDLIGDLGLLGLPIAGKVIASKTGHSFNREVVVHYISNPDLWKKI